MREIERNKGKQIKRRNFFYFFGAALAGASALFNVPFKNIKSKFSQKTLSIKISENPNAVKRQPKGLKYG